MGNRFVRVWTLLLILVFLAGCTRTHYRVKADRDTYSVLDWKTARAPWMPPAGYTIQPDPRSRFFDPTPTDDPILPIPAPRLYAYRLPDLAERDRARFRNASGPNDPMGSSHSSIRRLPAVEGPSPADGEILQVAHVEQLPAPNQEAQQGEPPGEPGRTSYDAGVNALVDSAGELRVVPIPKWYWQSIPESCLIRMFEFQSVRDEYVRTEGREPSPDQRDDSQRLTLEDIVELALINSREYQTQKETLYRVALRVSLERFDYALKFATGGNGSAADFIHNRNGGITENELLVPSAATSDKVLATGGDLLARFANSVVLTFNGPSGFAADVGSELLMDISQSVLQRDIVFEGLTQSERDVVYAARDFARFRKQFFRDLAATYYNLLLTYRQIEIATQDYFSNTRGFNQAEAEYRAGRQPRFQVDQFEQDVLASRSGLISSCNSLEQGLDDLKFQVGLPPEMPLNLDLAELEELTLRDESMASAERVRRSRRNLETELQEPSPDRSVLINGASDLTRRMLDLLQLRARLGYDDRDSEALQVLLAELMTDEARVLVRLNRDVLAQERRTVPPPPPLRIFQRTVDLLDSILALVSRQLDLAAGTSLDPQTAAAIQEQHRELSERVNRLRDELAEAATNRQLGRIPLLVGDAEALLEEADKLERAGDSLIGSEALTPREEADKSLQQAHQLLAQSEQMMAASIAGLVPIEIDMDDALLTGLVQRFDLMNERGALADTWRRIKLAGDDLKSVLNLNATQVVRTRNNVNRAFDFTWDESQTRLSMTWDTPLNRRAQRNVFRRSLIDYQAGLRSLMELEDSIKLSLRADLRQLLLDREQYQIAVASAALAYERVVSTRLQLQLEQEGITARDVLESQRAYTASLNAVAAAHIRYILDRIRLFLDLELLVVDDSGFWPQLYNESYQPQPNYLAPAPGPVYGELPQGVWYSHRVRRMLDVPPGSPEVYSEQPEERPEDQMPEELAPVAQP